MSREPLTYESLTRNDKKRREKGRKLQALCPKCKQLTREYVEWFFAGGRWHLGKIIGERCHYCNWGFDYDEAAKP